MTVTAMTYTHSTDDELAVEIRTHAEHIDSFYELLHGIVDRVRVSYVRGLDTALVVVCTLREFDRITRALENLGHNYRAVIHPAGSTGF